MLNSERLTHVAREIRQDGLGSAEELAVLSLAAVEAGCARPPVVVTHDPDMGSQKIMMLWKSVELEVTDRMKLLALTESLTRSGVQVVHADLADAPFSVWARDAYFRYGTVAHVLNPAKRDQDDFAFPYQDGWRDRDAVGVYAIGYALRGLGQDAILFDDVFFRGGDLIADPNAHTVYWSRRNNTSPDFSCSLFSRMRDAHGDRLSFVPVRTDRTHVRLSFGLSPMLPRGEFLVSTTLGNNGGDDAEGYQALVRRVSSKRLITVSRRDAEGMATNLIAVGNTLFMTSCSPDLRRTLEQKHGYIVNAPQEKDIGADWCAHDPACYRRIGPKGAGGGVHCLTNELSPG